MPAHREPKPLVVLMSGAPGSGKSTVARLLGEELRLPVIDKDRLREGALWTTGGDIDEAPSGPELFYSTIEGLLAHGISLIGDMTLFPGVSEPDIAARIAPRADLSSVHCRTPDAIHRFETRMRADPMNRSRVDALMPRVRALQDLVYEPLDLACPFIVVDTTDGFVPSIDAIAAWIRGSRTAPSSLGGP